MRVVLFLALIVASIYCDQIDEFCKLNPEPGFCHVKHDDPSCVQEGFFYNEQNNPMDVDDNLLCINDCMCDGIRKCIDETKQCETIQARSEEYCKRPDYHIDPEKKLCRSACDCNGARYCKRFRCTDPEELTL